jgi:hypothetical protein
MGTSSHFKHVNGRNGKVESICMNCLLAVGICCSDAELIARERSHDCKSSAEQAKQFKTETATDRGAVMICAWKQLVANLTRGKLRRRTI